MGNYYFKIITPKSNKIQRQGQSDCDCDCACVAENVSLSLPTSSGSLWWVASEAYQQRLSSLYDLSASPSYFSGVVLLNAPAHRVLNIFKEPISFQDAAVQMSNIDLKNFTQHVQKLAELGMINPFLASQRAYNTLPGIMTGWLQLTDRCNLRCSYCYLSHERQDMSIETGRAAVKAAFRSAVSHACRQVKLKYSGGEPLLRFPLIVELHRYAQQLTEQHGLELDGVVLSNGTLLTREIIKTLKSLDLRLMISLDGWGDFHNRQRSYANGRESFDDVIGAVKLALSEGLVPDISITISGRTVDGLAELISWVLERELPFSLNFYRENTCSAPHTDLRLNEERVVKGLLAAYKVIEANLPRHSLLSSSLVDRANLSTPHLRTCGVGQNYLVFDTKGRVSKCQMRMDAPISDASAADPLENVRTDQSGIRNMSVEEKEGCRDCQWRYWCAGGCPLETYRVTGRYDLKSPNCNIYQALFPEILRLEGLRLLKYQDDPQIVEKIAL